MAPSRHATCVATPRCPALIGYKATKNTKRLSANYVTGVAFVVARVAVGLLRLGLTSRRQRCCILTTRKFLASILG